MTALHQPSNHRATGKHLTSTDQDTQIHLKKQALEYMDSHHEYHIYMEAAERSVASNDKPSGEITDAQWEMVAPLLTLGRGLGRPYADTRRTLNGILYVLRAQCGWRNMPRRYGSYVTCWRRLARWQAKGIWKQVEPILS